MLDLRAFRAGSNEARDRLARRDDPGILEALDRALALDARRREVISRREHGDTVMQKFSYKQLFITMKSKSDQGLLMFAYQTGQ